MNIKLRALTLSLLAVPLLVDDASAQIGKFVLTKGNHELPVVVAQMADYLERNILLDPAECGPAGNNPLRISRDISVGADGCVDLLNSILAHRSMAIVTLNKRLEMYEVVSLQGAKRSMVSSSAQYVVIDDIEKYATLSATPILTVMPLNHVNATVATNALRPFFAAGGNMGSTISIGNLGDNRSLILQGMGDQVAAAVRLVRRADVDEESTRAAVKVVALKHADATAVGARLEELLGQQNNMPQGAGYGEAPMRIAVDTSLNSVLLSGPLARLERAVNLVARLDVEKDGEAPPSLEARIQKLEEQVKQLQKALGPRGGGGR